MLLPGRNGSSDGYRYGYQGSEKDDEVKGEGNSYTTHWRQYDSRVARWLSIDPKFGAFETPYSSMRNNPILYNDKKGDTIKGVNGFDKKAYRKSLVQQRDLLAGYKKTPIPGIELDEGNLKEKLAEFNKAIETFDNLDSRKEIIYIKKGDSETNANEAWKSFDLSVNAPRIDIGTGVPDSDYNLISLELLHVEDYFSGSFSFSSNGTAGVLVDIYDEIGPNNRQNNMNLGISKGSKSAVKYNRRTLAKKRFSDGTTPYSVLPQEKRTLSDKKWSVLLKTATEESVRNGTQQPHFYFGWQEDRESAKKKEGN